MQQLRSELFGGWFRRALLQNTALWLGQLRHSQEGMLTSRMKHPIPGSSALNIFLLTTSRNSAELSSPGQNRGAVAKGRSHICHLPGVIGAGRKEDPLSLLTPQPQDLVFTGISDDFWV